MRERMLERGLVLDTAVNREAVCVQDPCSLMSLNARLGDVRDIGASYPTIHQHYAAPLPHSLDVRDSLCQSLRAGQRGTSAAGKSDGTVAFNPAHFQVISGRDIHAVSGTTSLFC